MTRISRTVRRRERISQLAGKGTYSWIKPKPHRSTLAANIQPSAPLTHESSRSEAVLNGLLHIVRGLPLSPDAAKLQLTEGPLFEKEVVAAIRRAFPTIVLTTASEQGKRLDGFGETAKDTFLDQTMGETNQSGEQNHA